MRLRRRAALRRRRGAGPGGAPRRPLRAGARLRPGAVPALRRFLAGIAAGLLLALSLPPFGWWISAWVGAALLAVGVRAAPSWRARLGLGWSCGLGVFIVGLWWMQEFSLPGAIIAVPLEAAFWALAVAVLPRGRRGVWGLPAVLVLAEAARDRVPFGGVPLGGVDLGQVGGPLAVTARLGGHLLLVGLISAIGVGLAEVRMRWRDDRHPPGGLVRVAAGGMVGVVGLVGLVLGARAMPAGRVVGSVRAAVVQGGGPRGLRSVDRDPSIVEEAQFAASATVQPPVDLVLWPEDVIHVARLAGSASDLRLAGLANRLGAPVVAGVVEDAGPTHFANLAVLWSPRTGLAGVYRKVHRVPFGEYVPFRSLLSRLVDLHLVPADAEVGHGPGVLAGRLGVAVSYEVFFADRARAAARAGGELLLVPTNAASFRTGQVPAQELGAARLRAIETGRDVLQAAPTGYSAVVRSDGRVLARSGLGRRQVILATVHRRSGLTPYVRFGDAPVVGLSLVALAFRWMSNRKSEH
ncbi:MAG: apolipoprotein N-acyltransferase [Acidimicrobiales bacterium]